MSDEKGSEKKGVEDFLFAEDQTSEGRKLVKLDDETGYGVDRSNKGQLNLLGRGDLFDDEEKQRVSQEKEQNTRFRKGGLLSAFVSKRPIIKGNTEEPQGGESESKGVREFTEEEKAELARKLMEKYPDRNIVVTEKSKPKGKKRGGK